MSNTKTIAKNAGWYGLERAIEFAVTTFTSIAVARTLGPSKMGYIIYVIWLASVISSLGSVGIPATTRKYMAEFLGKGDRGTARYIYFRTLLLQGTVATIATCGILFVVLRNAQSGYRGASVLIALSIWPAMANSVSSQANVAAEKLSANLPASAFSTVTYLLGIVGTVLFGWGVIGVGASMLAMRIVDCAVRLGPTLANVLSWDEVRVSTRGLEKRMFTFACQSVATMIVALVVWDRSEFFLLKHLSSDIRQIAFYSIAFTMADRLILGSTIFSSATGATIFAQYGRDKSRIPEIVASATRYLAIIAIPLHAIFAALAMPALVLLYGTAYRGAGAVVSLAPLLCMPKAFIAPVQDLLQSAERQGYVIAATVVAGVLDVGVACWLIPSHGALGACIGSGVAQTTAVGIMWTIGIRSYRVQLPWKTIAKVSFASLVAAAMSYVIRMRLDPIWGFSLGGVGALMVLSTLFYVLRIFQIEDCERIQILADKLPKTIARRVKSALWFFGRVTPSRTIPEACS